MTSPLRPRQAGGLRVLVVDHRRAISEALAFRLGQESDIDLVAVANSPAAAEGALDAWDPTVGTVAIDLRDAGGLGLIAEARRSHPAIRWVVVGTEAHALELTSALAAGASGYVTMRSSAAAFADAIREAAGRSSTPTVRR